MQLRVASTISSGALRGNKRPLANSLSFGLTVVAALLWFAGFVVLLRGDFERPWLGFALFAALGGLVWLVGRLIGRSAR